MEGYYRHSRRSAADGRPTPGSTPASRTSAAQVKEQRRPKHSGSIALDGTSGTFSYGASIAYTGERTDTNFDVFPSAR